MSKKRHSFSAEFKAKVGPEALKGIEPVHVIGQRHEVHPVQASQWKKEVAERLPEVFATPLAQVKDGILRGTGRRRICTRTHKDTNTRGQTHAQGCKAFFVGFESACLASVFGNGQKLTKNALAPFSCPQARLS